MVNCFVLFIHGESIITQKSKRTVLKTKPFSGFFVSVSLFRKMLKLIKTKMFSIFVYYFKSCTSLFKQILSLLATTTVKCKPKLHVGFEPTFSIVLTGLNYLVKARVGLEPTTHRVQIVFWKTTSNLQAKLHTTTSYAFAQRVTH